MFSNDLEEWRNKEKEFAKYLLDKRIANIEFAPDKKFTDWDLKRTKNWDVKTYEIKFDKKAEETWNLAIEYRFNWKPSWMFKSKADYIVYSVYGKRYIENRAELLLKILENYQLWLIQKKEWWDLNSSSLYIIPLKYIDKIFSFKSE